MMFVWVKNWVSLILHCFILVNMEAEPSGTFPDFYRFGANYKRLLV